MNSKIATGVTKLALLIDGDNVSAARMSFIMQEAEKLGSVATRRIYGQFTAGRMKSWGKAITEFDLAKVDVIPARKGKNATDIRLAIDATEMLLGRGLDGICIVSSDSDFTPLAAHVRSNAVMAFGFGETGLPKAYRDAFDKFVPIDDGKPSQARKRVAGRSALGSATKKPAVKPPAPPKQTARSPALKTAAKAPPPPRATREAAAKSPQLPQATPKATRSGAGGTSVPVLDLLAAMDKMKRADGWSHFRDLGNELARAGFSPAKNHYKVASLVKLHPSFVEVSKRGNDTYVRRKPS
jgi:hypothetical protein